MNTTTYTPVSLDKIDTLDSSTLGIIELAKALLSDKQYLPKSEFTKIIKSFGWGKRLVQRYLKIALAFADVEINKLAKIEPCTLFKITSTKRFANVVQGIRNSVGHVTQQLVENLIEASKRPRTAKPDKPSIWRAEKDGSRSCVVPPIKEDDQYTGMSIQRAMDNEGMTAQSFVREAAAFREACLSGAFLLVGELPPHLQTILGDKLEYSAPTPVDDIEVKTSNEQNETDETVEVVEAVETAVEPMEVSQIQVAIETSIEVNEDSPLNNSTETKPYEKIADLVVQCTTSSEIVAITSGFDERTGEKSCNVLAESDKQCIKIMKGSCETIPSIKVGDKVNWENHYPHLSQWLPLEVQEINNGQVRLELCNFLVPIEELSLAQ
ncbi:MAG: hypothetical protein KME60_04625 [Cyanomargarita calcarea GSE-NOS-MK-12-04C]|jgi:hypothetical protein|uniref:Uncharacterized protein n=1 Tax=Cyanomargarita calcarea GSE-NOS-MK-12-04C TaxID=2839659 RepID=A0A951QLI5_9CYAN|nr:hypothetical protein [Cyanomargarita calcarea GSE-NOS-MK-12-04C]